MTARWLVAVAAAGVAGPGIVSAQAVAGPQAAGAATPPQVVASVAPGNAVGEVVVTAQRRSQNLQDVPASIAAVSGARLEQRSIVTVNALSSVVTNLQISQPYGSGSPPAFTIRGISSTDFSQNQSRPIAVYMDEGVRQLPSLETMPLFDIDHVEVLRGPQGALYGKDATGGAINIISTRPGFENAGYFQAGYGNFNRRESEGAVQAPLIDDKLTLRLAYTYVEDDGTIQNLYPRARNVEQTDVFGFRASALFKPNDAIEFLLRYTHYSSGGRNPGVYAADIDFVGAGFPELATLPGANRQGLSFFQNSQNYLGHRDIDDDGLNLQTNVKLPFGWKLASITTYDRGKWDETVDADGLAIDQERDVDNANDIRQFVEEWRLSGQLAGARVLLGTFYSRDHVETFQRFAYFIDSNCTISCGSDGLDGLGDGSRGSITTNALVQNRNSYATYGRVEYDLTDRLTLAGGLRWSRDEVEVKNYQAFLGDVAHPLAVQTIAPTDLSKAFENVSGEAVLTWKPTRHLTSYASFKQGYRTGAFNAQAFSSVNEITAVPPETADSWEVGLKSQALSSRLTANVAGFYAIYKNQQVVDAEVVDGGTIYPLRSVARSRIAGAEADLTFRPVSRLTLAGSVGYTDAIYTRGVVDGESVAGNQLTNSAKWSSNASADWRILDFGDATLNFRADAAYQSKVYFDVHNLATTTDKGHTVTGLSLSYDRPHWSLTAWTLNLFDTHYITYALDTSSEGFVYEARGTPRQFGLRARVNL